MAGVDGVELSVRAGLTSGEVAERIARGQVNQVDERSSRTLAEIIRAVDGPITAGDFGEPHTDGACDHEGQCVLLAIWGAAGAHMRTFLDGFSLADIAAMAQGRDPWPPDADRSAQSVED